MPSAVVSSGMRLLGALLLLTACAASARAPAPDTGVDLGGRVWHRAIVSVHGPLALTDDTEPEPDLAVLRRRDVPYKEREAWAEDALLVIEVAESSLAYDRSTKMRLYAEAGIPEYWVVDCAAETVEVRRGPGPDGYRDVSQVAGTAMLTLQAFPGVELTPADIFA